jgi:hypothetical protein
MSARQQHAGEHRGQRGRGRERAPNTASAAGRQARACSRAAAPDTSTTAILTISVVW